MKPTTTYDLLRLLETYHQQRRDTYGQLAARGTDPRAVLLLNRLIRLEEDAIGIVQEEMGRVPADHATYLPSGPMLAIDPGHAMDCRCDADPTFDQALACALTSDEALDDVIDRLAGSSPADSVQAMASRLRELERTKDRQIANFTRED